jgi:MFS family permease
MAASFFLPSVFTAVIGDILASRFGRRICVANGVAIILIGSLINALAINVGMWVAGQLP